MKMKNQIILSLDHGDSELTPKICFWQCFLSFLGQNVPKWDVFVPVRLFDSMEYIQAVLTLPYGTTVFSRRFCSKYVATALSGFFFVRNPVEATQVKSRGNEFWAFGNEFWQFGNEFWQFGNEFLGFGNEFLLLGNEF